MIIVVPNEIESMGGVCVLVLVGLMAFLVYALPLAEATKAAGVLFLVCAAVAASTTLYFLPTLVSIHRSVNPTVAKSVVFVNTLLGWTGVAWFVALCMACGAKRRTVKIPQPAFHVTITPKQQEGASDS